jgi:prolyl-tRNA editing enzyme YbaK/EbsC (Cys-tRNA(Pro) deacylase)
MAGRETPATRAARQAATALDLDADRVFKTLVVDRDGRCRR